VKYFAARLMALAVATVFLSAPVCAQTDNGTTLHKAFRGVSVQLNLGRLPIMDLIMAFTSEGTFFYTRNSKFNYRPFCVTGSYTMDKTGSLAAVLQDESYRTEASFKLIGELLIGSGAVRAVPDEEADFTWPFPLYRFVYIGRHTAAADSRMEQFLAECAAGQ
jgi:hypothetical protein